MIDKRYYVYGDVYILYNPSGYLQKEQAEALAKEWSQSHGKRAIVMASVSDHLYAKPRPVEIQLPDGGLIQWFQVEHYKPPQKRLLMVTGDSGCGAHRKFLTLAYLDDDYRPPLADGLPRWLSVQNDALNNQGWKPTHWALPIDLP